MSIPGTSCSITDDVLVRGHYRTQLNDGANVNWIKNNVTYTGGNPVVVSNYNFFVTDEFIVDEDITFTDCNFLFAKDAKITVDGADLTFNDVDDQVNKLWTCNPNVFWDGIYVDGNNGDIMNMYGQNQQNTEREIEVSNSTNGIVVQNSAAILLRNVRFNRNKRAMKISKTGTQNASLIRIIDCEFLSSTPLKASDGTDYFPAYSIEASNLNQVADVIEFESTLQNDNIENIFDATSGGIYFNNANMNILSSGFSNANVIKFNDFQNLTYTLGSPPVSETPISITGGSGVNKPSANINNCTFTNCKNAIYTNGAVELNVFTNTFNINNSDLAVISNFATINNNSEQVNISGNTINNVSTAIACFNNPSVEINNNTIDMETQTGSGYTSKLNYQSTGISITNYSISGPQNISIHNNEIHHAKTSIVTQFAEALIEENKIYELNNHFVQATGCYPFTCPPPPPAFGIRTMNSKVIVEKNKVENDASVYSTQPSTNIQVIGISIENAANPQNAASSINCNKVKNTGIGLRFAGNCGSGTEILNNHMEDHTRGFILTNQANIGDVGSSSGAAENTWQGSYTNGSETYNYSYAQGANPTHFVLSGAGPNIGPAHASQNYLPMTTTTVSSGNSLSCSAPALQRYNTGNGATTSNLKSGGSRKPQSKFKRGEVSDSAYILNNQLIYLQLLKDSTLYNSKKWRHFRDSMNNTVLGRLNKKNTRQSFTTLNSQDQNLLVIESAMNQLDSNSTLDSTEMGLLYNIALKCPYDDGVAVYQARSILHEFGFPLIINSCEQVPNPQSISKKRLKKAEEAEKTFAIYPNPTEGLVNINFEVKEGEAIFFELYDVVGRKVFKNRISTGNTHQLKLNEMQQGIFIYRLLNAKQVVESGKLIID